MPKQRKNRTAEQRKRLELEGNSSSQKTQKRDLFETGLEALEVPILAIGTHLTPTAASLYQVMLLNMHRETGKLGKRKVKEYARIIARDEMSVYSALSELNEKKFIKTTTEGWIRGEVLMRHKNVKKSDAQQELPGMPLSRALVHRQALKIMIQFKLSGLAQRLYWEFATQIDTHTGKIAERQVKALAERFGVKKPAIYKSIRQLNAAGLTNFENDFGVTGHMPHVALAYGTIRLAVERKMEQAVNGRTAEQKFERYRVALYKLFGVPIEALSRENIKRGIEALKEKLKPYAEPPEEERKDYLDPNGEPWTASPLRWDPKT